MKTTPIKRHSALQPVSRDHHHGLMLCWKIRTGLRNNIAPERVKKYVDYFFTEQLLPHFEIEEKYIFPVLGDQHEMVKKALAEHRRLTRLINSNGDLLKNLHLIEEELEQHIRFEERVLFNEVQKIATEEELHEIKIHHNSPSKETNEWKDSFWAEKNN